MSLFPSASLWFHPPPLEEALHRIKITAFHYVDLHPAALDAPGVAQALKDLGLKLSCVALDYGLPKGLSLDGKDDGTVRRTVDHIRAAIRKAAPFQPLACYVGSCADSKGLKRFDGAVRELAEEAGSHGIKFCIEHVPGRALSTARDALAFVQNIDHPNVFLLLDVGHTLISGENPWEIVEAAGGKIGAVQLNDNNGRKDHHWALLDGRLTSEDLVRTLAALKKIGYGGTLGLELKAKRRLTLLSDFARNHNLILRILGELEKEPKTA